MAWFRTKQRLVPWLVGLFLVAQLAGAFLSHISRDMHARENAVALRNVEGIEN